MKQKISKIVAFVLAFAMIVGVLPAGIPQASAAGAMEMSGVKEEYNFMAGNNETNWSYVGVNALNGNTKLAFKVDSGWYASFGQMWYENEWVAIKLNVPKAGRYKLQMAYNVGRNGVAVDVFTLPGNTALEGIDAALAEATSVCNIDTHDVDKQNVGNSRVNANDLTELGYVDFANAGENILVFRRDGRYTNDSSGFVFGKIVLNGLDIKPIEPMEMSGIKGEYNFMSAEAEGSNWSCIGVNALNGNTKLAFKVDSGWYAGFGQMWYENEWVAIKLNVPKAGRYKLQMAYNVGLGGIAVDVFALQGTSVSMDSINDICDELEPICTIDTHDTTVGKNVGSYRVDATDLKELGCVDFANAGENILVFRRDGRYTNDSSGFNFGKIVLDGNYGDTGVIAKNSAYIREVVKNGKTSYAIEFLGAIKQLTGYSEVGFEVSVNGGEAIKYGGQNVYTALAMTDTDITPGQFGKDASYIIWETVAGFAAGDNVVFRAYAKDADGNYTYGYQYVITATK